MKTDEQLRSDICLQLAHNPAVRGIPIAVEVTNGIVTLRGQVRAFWQKWHAECAAQRVLGIKALMSRIQVRQSAERAASDHATALGQRVGL
jgi:osmotically-inducible protein OsmY